MARINDEESEHRLFQKCLPRSIRAHAEKCRICTIIGARAPVKIKEAAHLEHWLLRNTLLRHVSRRRACLPSFALSSLS
eukprot:963988-Pyramimonas_sp.AAC.1